MIKRGGVAFFDSGVGGLSVLKECLPLLLGVPVYYYGDNAFAPYGNKSEKELAPRVYRAFDTFERLGVSVAVIACNTVTALFLEKLQSLYSFSIIGVAPAMELSVGVDGETLVLATKATIENARIRAHAKKIEKQGGKLCLAPCPKLAGEIEAHCFENNYDYTPFLPIANPALVVLGCTHYPFIREQIQNFYGCRAVDGHQKTAEKLAKILPKTQKNQKKR